MRNEELGGARNDLVNRCQGPKEQSPYSGGVEIDERWTRSDQRIAGSTVSVILASSRDLTRLSPLLDLAVGDRTASWKWDSPLVHYGER